MWLAPEQVRLLPIADRHLDFTYEVKKRLEEKGIRVDVDARNEKIGYKIREARLEKLPYMCIIGDNECDTNSVSVRERGENGDLGSMSVEDFINRCVEETANRVIKK